MHRVLRGCGETEREESSSSSFSVLQISHCFVSTDAIHKEETDESAHKYVIYVRDHEVKENFRRLRASLRFVAAKAAAVSVFKMTAAGANGM